MKDYELGIIFHPSLEQADVQPAIDKVSRYVQAGGGNVASVNVWGRRPLVYPIQRQQEGTYVFVQAQLESRAISELERSLKLDESIIRYLLVHKEG
jgi:small subunit ribosomal protein S6